MQAWAEGVITGFSISAGAGLAIAFICIYRPPSVSLCMPIVAVFIIALEIIAWSTQYWNMGLTP